MTKKTFCLSINVDKFEKVKKISKLTKLPINAVIEIIISEIDREFEYLEKFNYNENEIQIKFRITESEKEFLEEQSLKSGANSLSAEIKYRLLNTIYKNKFFTNNEMKEFIKSRYEINMIGRNLNQLLKQIYTKDDYKLDKDEIKNLIYDIDKKINKHSDDLRELEKFTDNRF